MLRWVKFKLEIRGELILYYTFKNVWEIVYKSDRPLLLFLKIGTRAACFHKVGNFHFNKLILKVWHERGEKVCGQLLIIKLWISSGPMHFEELRCRWTECLKNQSKMNVIWNNDRRRRVKNRRKTTRRCFSSKLQLCYYFFPNSEFAGRMIILFKLRNIFARVIRLGYKIIILRF